MEDTIRTLHVEELAVREADGLHVALNWDTQSGRLWVVVVERPSGRTVEVDAPSGLALDVYYHPFAYRSLQVT